jgi:hypothetical protein
MSADQKQESGDKKAVIRKYRGSIEGVKCENCTIAINAIIGERSGNDCLKGCTAASGCYPVTSRVNTGDFRVTSRTPTNFMQERDAYSVENLQIGRDVVTRPIFSG